MKMATFVCVGNSRVRDDEELAGCSDDSPFENESALFRIEVIQIPKTIQPRQDCQSAIYLSTLVQARWPGFGTVVKAHKPRVRRISVMTSRPTLKSDWLPVPVQGMVFCWISLIPPIKRLDQVIDPDFLALCNLQ